MKKYLSILIALSFLPGLAIADSTVNATAGTGATISPSGTVVVPTGITQTFATGASNGFILTNVSVDGTSLGAVSSTDFTGTALDLVTHTIDVTARVNGSGPLPWCSGPYAPGWNVSLPGGGCGSTETFVPFGGSIGTGGKPGATLGATCPFFQGCMVPNKQ